jgi:hypothetical protein
MSLVIEHFDIAKQLSSFRRSMPARSTDQDAVADEAKSDRPQIEHAHDRAND